MEDRRNEEQRNEEVNPESREGAALAGGYNAPGGNRVTWEESVPEDLGTQPLATNEDDEIASQADREGAGPFTGTGNQDALRTAGRAGSTDANSADQRTSGDESAVDGDVSEDEQRRIDAAEQVEDAALAREDNADNGGNAENGGGASV